MLLRRSPRRDVRQGEMAECGLAALAALMSRHGGDFSLETLRTLAASTVYGTSIRTLREIAIRCGFEASIQRLEDPRELQALTPCLAHLNFIHFAVVEGVTRNEILLQDPLSGPTRTPLDRFSREFTGIAMTLRRTAFVRKGDAPPRPSRWQLLRAAGPAYAAALVAAWCAGAALSAAIVAAGARFQPAMVAGGIVIAAAASELAVRLATGALASRAAGEHRRIVPAIAEQPASAFILRSPLQHQATLAAPLGLLDPAFISAPLAAAALTATLIGAFVAQPLVGGLGGALIAVEAALLAALALGRGAAPAQLRQPAMPIATPSGWDLAHVESWALGGGPLNLFRGLAGAQARSAMAAMPGAERGAALAGLRAAASVGRMLALLAVAAVSGVPPTPAAAAIILTMVGGSLLGRVVAGLRTPAVTAALHRLAEPVPPPVLHEPAAPGPGLALSFEAVSWRPAALLPDVVSAVSFTIPSANALAIIVPPRAGATTIARLAAGWLIPTRGVVRHGRAILVERRWPFGAGRIRDILASGGDADEAEMSALFDALGLAAALAPRGGLDLRLSEPAIEISGGQRRRLMVAAALLRRPELLVLDGTLDALGADTAAELLRLCRSRGTAILLAGHREDIAAACDARFLLQ